MNYHERNISQRLRIKAKNSSEILEHAMLLMEFSSKESENENKRT